MSTFKGYMKFPPVTIANPHIEERLLTDEETNERFLRDVPEKQKKICVGASEFRG